MDCFTSPTKNRLSPWDRASKMAFCTPLVSWYSSTMISTYRLRHSRARGDGFPSPSVRRAAVRCSPSAKSMRRCRPLRATKAWSNSATTSNRAVMAGAMARRSSMASAPVTWKRCFSFSSCFLQLSRNPLARSFKASSQSPRLALGRSKATCCKAWASSSQPWASCTRSRP